MTIARRVFSAFLSVACIVAAPPAWARAPTPGAPEPAGAPAAGASVPRPALPANGAPETPASAATPAVPTVASPPAPPASPLNPTPEEFPEPGGTAANADLDALMARVAALRARIAALGAAMFTSTLRIELRSQSDTARLKALRVSLDGGIVYTAAAAIVFDRPELVYEHAVAAGPHVVAVEVERQDLLEPQFSTWQTSRFVVVVPEKRLLWTRLELEDESSLGEDFKEDEAGQYELSVRLQVETSE